MSSTAFGRAHKVDPLARQVGKNSEVLGRREPLRLEAPHLTRRSRAPLRRFAADNPGHSRSVAQAFHELDQFFARDHPDWVLVQGDTTSAMVAATTAFCLESH
jgi:hypothetical protein